MKKTVIIAAVLPVLLSLLISTACQKIEKPAVNGKGPLALNVIEGLSAPDHHKPADRWIAMHMDKLNSGRLRQDECISCHTKPDNFCNKCHLYIGAKKIIVQKTGLQLK